MTQAVAQDACPKCGEVHDRKLFCPAVTCPTCGKCVGLEFGFISTHREPESSAHCPASGTTIGSYRR